jgi:transcriptional regulator with XRE-family HTH domain
VVQTFRGPFYRIRRVTLEGERKSRRRALGVAIRERRLQARLTQDQLASLVQIDRKSISRLETGTYSPSVDRLWAISDALGLALDELIRRALEGLPPAK